MGQTCDCAEYIYLNEPPSGSIHKYLVNADGSLTEIGSPWFDNPTGEVNSPHGVTMDQNGNIYVGEHIISSDIRRINCDGELLPQSEFAIPTGGQYNLGSLDNYVYYNDRAYGGIVEHDLCTGAKRFALYCESVIPSRDWGFYVDPVTGLMYATYNLSTTGGTNYVWVMSQADFDNDPTTCVSSFPLDPEFPVNDAEIRGVTTDNSGNIYIVIQDDDNITPVPAYILKFDSNGNYLATSPTDSADDGVGFNKAIGIVYSATANLIYVSTEANFDDCIAIFDTNLNYVGTGVPAPGGGDRGKGIAITTECCPVSTPVVVNTTVCAGMDERVSLQDLLACSSAICEGEWQADAGNVGFTYNSCDETVTVVSPGACGSFTYSSDGTNPLSQCGAFSITVNVNVVTAPTVTINENTTVCSGGVVELSGTVDGTDAATYQWQSSTVSCNTGFTDIPGATSLTYSASPSSTTYYRLLVMSSMMSDCASADCATPSNCMILTVDSSCSTAVCDSPGCDPVPEETLCVDGSETMTLSCEDIGLSNISWYNGDGVAVGTSCDLMVTPSMIGDGMIGASMCFFYTATDTDGCPYVSCCPIIIKIIDCCPTENCFGVTVIKN